MFLFIFQSPYDSHALANGYPVIDGNRVAFVWKGA